MIKPGLEALSRRCMVSVRACEKSIVQLKMAGYIHFEKGKGGRGCSNTYTISEKGCTACQVYSQETLHEMPKNPARNASETLHGVPGNIRSEYKKEYARKRALRYTPSEEEPKRGSLRDAREILAEYDRLAAG